MTHKRPQLKAEKKKKGNKQLNKIDRVMVRRPTVENIKN